MASQGELFEYEEFLVDRFNTLFSDCAGGKNLQDSLLHYSGIAGITIIKCLEYAILLSHLLDNANDFSKEKTLYLLQKFHSDREFFTANMYSLNMKQISETFLAGSNPRPSGGVVSDDVLREQGFPSWDHFCMAMAISNEKARFQFEALVWWYAVWIPLLKLGYPKPNQYNQSIQWMADTSKAQADKKWMEAADQQAIHLQKDLRNSPIRSDRFAMLFARFGNILPKSLCHILRTALYRVA